MPGPFEGMGTILAGALGAPVIHRPGFGMRAEKTWIVRTYPEEVFPGEARPVAGVEVELRVPRHEADEVSRGDEIETAEGVRYRVGPRRPTPNPAPDALIQFELTEI